MPIVERTALILLAAGRATRFGSGKLAQPLLGRPLGLHVAETLAGLAFAERIAVVGDAPLDYRALGFRCVTNPDPAAGLAGSVRLGVAAAAGGVEIGAVLIVLADMPQVTAAHVLRLFAAASEDGLAVASSDGRVAGPPALFGRELFAPLMAVSGDAGARDLIRAGRHVVASPDELVDVDTVEELDRLRAMFNG